jgi:arginyl-tRNA synthetase
MKFLLEDVLAQALASVTADSTVGVPDPLPLEATRDPRHGDLATSAALALAKPLRRSPRSVAEAIVAALPANVFIEKVEIAGPGFINFFLTPAAFQQIVRDIRREGARWGHAAAHSRGSILLEFVSANPTGPLHVGHGRGAAYGDALARILDAAGWRVHREYYINDAGRQTEILAISVWLRYLESFGEPVPFPEAGYPGDYVRVCAEHLRATCGERLRRPLAPLCADLPADAAAGGDRERFVDALIERMRALLGAEDYAELRQRAIADQLADIRATLDALGVHFDRWSSEAEVVASGAVERALAALQAQQHSFRQDGALWLRSSALGDEKDRVLIKADGQATYFANDLAYHLDKLERGYETLLDVWGADHHGYVARMRAAIAALTGRAQSLEVQLMQFVTLASGRMGKRSGNFVTLRELVTEAGRDATRFIYLTRSHDQHLEFDVELARSASNDNPVYYVQYAHARLCSLFRQAGARSLGVPEADADIDLSGLTEAAERALIGVLARFPEVIEQAAQTRSPHLMTFYLRDVADAFHRNYNLVPYLVDDDALRHARLGLAQATRQVIASGLDLLGVHAPEAM